MCTDVSDVAVLPGVGVLVSPIIDGSSDIAPAVGHAELTLTPVDNGCVQDMLWAPAATQDTRPNDDRKIPVPRWRLAREGSFLAERSPGAHLDIQRITSGGLWPTPAPLAVHRMEQGPPVGWTYRNW